MLEQERTHSVFKVSNALNELARRRPVFHSEADFQHALAWHLHETIPGANVRLEYRPAGADVRLDLWLWMPDGQVAVELKYVTRQLSTMIDDERFELRNQSAQDVRRYDFVKDIARLERVVEAIPDTIGIAVLLTNEPLYWLETGRAGTSDAAFRLQEGRGLGGTTLSWGPFAGPGTVKGRESPLVLQRIYHLKWQDYSTLDGTGAGRFRFLSIEVPRRPTSALMR